jgi:2,3-bisphosphoglycerate-dependent phosphoglycerate mutase
MESTIRVRKSARALLLNENNLMLWQHCRDDIGRGGQTTFWRPPGGGLEVDESFEQALRRELWEEVGLQDVEIGLHAATVAARVVHCGEPIFEKSQIYLVRVVAPELRFETPLERHLGWRWWSSKEISASSELFLPPEIIGICSEIAQGIWDGQTREFLRESPSVN